MRQTLDFESEQKIYKGFISFSLDDRTAAQRAAEFGAPAIPTLIYLLSDPHLQVRDRAAEALKLLDSAIVIEEAFVTLEAFAKKERSQRREFEEDGMIKSSEQPFFMPHSESMRFQMSSCFAQPTKVSKLIDDEFI